jgi:GH25 family lysozyme M1 (1,4-beta-N-acetylmuramidase)
MNAFGIDISKWNYSADGSKKPDFMKIKATCNFIAIRSGVSWGYADNWFSYSWQNTQNMCRMAYHVLYFGENAQRQADNLFKIVTPVDWAHDRLVLDLEVDGGNSKAKITQTTKDVMEICKARTGMYPILYSRANWIDLHLSLSDLPKADLWLAQYRYALPYPLYTPEASSPPALPTNVNRWLIHQTAEKYSGKEVGVSSYYVDSNRWNGDVHSVLDYFGFGEVEPDVPMSDSEKLDTLWAWYLESHG